MTGGLWKNEPVPARHRPDCIGRPYIFIMMYDVSVLEDCDQVESAMQ
jgi:hypothetical protein